MIEKTSSRRRGRKLAGMLAGGLALSVIPFAVPASAQTTALPPARDIGDFACPVDDQDTPATTDDTTEVPEDGFTDVPASNVHEFSIDCVAWYEITSGATATTYNPGGTVKREQMATFIAQLIDYAADNGTGTELPAAGTGNLFPCDVVATSTHFNNIQRLAAANIVEGTGDNADDEACFDPGGEVTRAQMASFLKNAQDFIIGTDLTPLPTNVDYFADDDGDTHEDNINLIASESIARGTGTNANNEALYSPGADIRRDQMASFLANKLDVLVDPDPDNDAGTADPVTVTPPPSVTVSVADLTPDQGADDVNVTVTSVRDTIESVDISGCGVPTATAAIDNDAADMSQIVPIDIPDAQAVGACDLTVVTELTGGRTVTTVVELTINAA